MDVWEDSQPDGPEPSPWIKPSGQQPHGYIEPSKWQVLGNVAEVRERKWRHLLNDMNASNRVWWSRLMRFMEGR